MDNLDLKITRDGSVTGLVFHVHPAECWQLKKENDVKRKASKFIWNI
jgi:hypothetical protein